MRRFRGIGVFFNNGQRYRLSQSDRRYTRFQGTLYFGTLERRYLGHVRFTTLLLDRAPLKFVPEAHYTLAVRI